MAEYIRCPRYGVEVTTTPPYMAAGNGTLPAQSTPVLWDRNGGRHSEDGCAASRDGEERPTFASRPGNGTR